MWTVIRYPVLHWLLTMLLGPLIIVGRVVVDKGDTLEGIASLFLISLIYGSLFSLPTLALYMLTAQRIAARIGSAPVAKAVLDLLVIIGVAVTLFMVEDSLVSLVFWPYCAAVVLASLFIKLEIRVAEAA